MRRVFSASAASIAILGAQFLASPALAYDGCLGAKVTACLEAIRPYLGPLGYQMARQGIDKYLAGDIAGKRKAKAVLSVPYHSKFADPLEPPQLLVLDYSSSLDIGEISITLRKGAGTAESEAEYQAMHMYEAIIFALGNQDNCPVTATPHDFYLFFHTQVKSKLKEKKQEHAKGEFKPASDYYAETGWLGICGRKLNYTMSSADWGSVQGDMTRKYGSYVTSLAFR
jgi:hypothetical protein